MSGRYNWDGRSHRRLYDDIHGNGGFFGADGAGVSGAEGTQEGWAELASVMARARERTEAALSNAGAVWEGGAADAMRSGVTPLAQWAADAHIASTASQQSTDSHVFAYSAAKNRMPEPVPVTSTANSDGLGIPAMYTHLLGGQTDQDKQEAAAQEAKAEAVRIMSGYEMDSTSAQARVGKFVPPPSVTVAVAPPTPKGRDGTPVGISEPYQPRPERGDGTAFPSDTSGGTGGSGGTPTPSGGSSPPPGRNSSSATAVTSPSASPVPTGVVADQVRGASPAVPLGGINTVGGPGERGPGGAGGPGGGLPGAAGGPVNQPVAGRVAGGGGPSGVGGMAPAGSRSDGDDDKEHRSAEYLRDFHDGFWDDSPPVSPAVLGEDEE